MFVPIAAEFPRQVSDDGLFLVINNQWFFHRAFALTTMA